VLWFSSSTLTLSKASRRLVTIKETPKRESRKERMSVSVVKKSKAHRALRPKPRSHRYMDRDELAELLGVHRETIKRLEREKKVPQPIKISRKIVLYDRTAVERFLQEAAQL
jgi:predicted DNA-binding transcriptional regulator AlpA